MGLKQYFLNITENTVYVIWQPVVENGEIKILAVCCHDPKLKPKTNPNPKPDLNSTV